MKAVENGFKKFEEEANKDLFAPYAVTGKRPEPDEQVTGKSQEFGLPCQVKEGMEADAKQAFEDFGMRILEIGGKKIAPEVLFECNSWSPRELEALEPIVAEPPLE